MKKIILGGISAVPFVFLAAGIVLAQELMVTPSIDTVSVNTSSVVQAKKYLKIITPVQGLVTSQKNIITKGQATGAIVEVNNQRMIVQKDHSFQGVLKINTGKNHFRFVADGIRVERGVIGIPVFDDLSSVVSSKKELEMLTALGYFNAQTNKIFPQRVVNRGEMAKILTKLASINVSKLNNPSIYKDVSSKTVNASEINALAQRRIMPGYEDGKFYPARVVPRGEAIVLLVRAAQLNTATDNEKIIFSDVTTAHWSYSAIYAATVSGILQAGGRFEPDRAITRLELATWLSKCPAVKAEIEKMFILDTDDNKLAEQ